MIEVLMALGPEQLACIVQALRRASLIALPTETVYGLAGDAFNPRAVAAIFALKKRPSTSPLIIHIASLERLSYCAQDYPAYVMDLVHHFWPGPLTLVLPKTSRVLSVVTGGQDTVAVRMPSHPVAQAVLQAYAREDSGCLVAPSANPFTSLSAVCVEQIQAYFGEAPGPLSYLIDAGQSMIGIESTILSCLSEEPVVLRPGAITAAALSEVISRPISYRSTVQDSSALRVPGDHVHHYRPAVPLYYGSPEFLCRQAALHVRPGVWIGHHSPPEGLSLCHYYELDCLPEVYMHSLFVLCYQAERLGAAYIAIETVPDTEAWLGVRDRLSRAASSWGEVLAR